MRVLGPVSFAGFLFAGQRGEADEFFSGIFFKTPQADPVRESFFVHEYWS
jgi:hypothetical protein